MPKETREALRWALEQVVTDEFGNIYPVATPREIVDKVREYFNEHFIEYDTFSYDDLIPFLPQ